MKNYTAIPLLVAFVGALAWGQGNQPGGAAGQQQTGTTNSQGQPNRNGGTITATTGNTATASTPQGTDPTFTPANRNPYNDSNYRPGTPGTNSNGAMNDPRFTSGNPSTLGTAQPANNPGKGNPTTPGLGTTTGRASTGGFGGAPTSGSVGTGGSGSGGAPGAISNSGTRGINGSGF